jgi:hypothetical protein
MHSLDVAMRARALPVPVRRFDEVSVFLFLSSCQRSQDLQTSFELHGIHEPTTDDAEQIRNYCGFRG